MTDDSERQGWSSRLAELAELRHGWLEGDGEPINQEALSFGREVLRILDERNLPLPAIFPVPTGGVLLEWNDPRHFVSLDIGPGAVCFGIIDSLTAELNQEKDVTSPSAAVDFAAYVLERS